MAERSYVQGQGRSREDPMPEGRQPRVLGCDGVGTAKRSYPTSEVRGSSREELPPAQGQGRRPGGATTPPRSGGCTGPGEPRGAIPRSRPGGAAVRRYPLSKVRSSLKEIPYIQGKRNPNKTVGTEKGHQWADRLKPQSQITSESDHMDHSLV